ncbi:hypothetical protein DFH11DRAFT_1541226 [Phellopilus nigrolimitatus]|nr:hypothetical protein DFH11DRAFT_1541226 [Phellopilus nigrolimitatus]
MTKEKTAAELRLLVCFVRHEAYIDCGLAKLSGRPDLHTVLTKLHVFRLTRFDKIIFLNADVLPMRPLSHLFFIPHEFSGVPDIGWPEIFNAGVMVGEDKLNEIMSLMKIVGS